MNKGKFGNYVIIASLLMIGIIAGSVTANMTTKENKTGNIALDLEQITGKTQINSMYIAAQVCSMANVQITDLEAPPKEAGLLETARNNGYNTAQVQELTRTCLEQLKR